MIVPARALVRPQVFISDCDIPLHLDDEIGERLKAREVGLIQLTGPPGSGKSTALCHVASLVGDDPRLLLTDCPDARETEALERAALDRLVVFAAAEGASVPEKVRRWRLAPWTQDILIEYLLAAHRDRCGSVMRRVLADPDRRALLGRAELWRAVLDGMAADASLPSVTSALRSAVASRLIAPGMLAAARQYCLREICHPATEIVAIDNSVVAALVGTGAMTLLRHELPQTLLAAEHLATALGSEQGRGVIASKLPESLVQETAALVAGNESVILRLQKLFDGVLRREQPMAASLLHAAKTNWTPKHGRAPLLAGAYLARCRWREIRLEQLNISKADLIECDLSNSRISGLIANEVQLSGASLRGAHVDQFEAQKAVLIEADLSHIRAPQSNFTAADLRRAKLDGALLTGAKLSLADLREACFRRTDLTGAELTGAQLEGADFSGADLASANLTGLTLRGVDFSGAQFTAALLARCDLENVTWPGARLDRANLRGANFTGSRMPNADMRRADLSGAGLAEIDWERVNLRGADLRGSTFHLGSSRSGLVGSPLACEGSRTGFYTDELYEQDFKSPEEIRKANLRGADLRGARILNVDFYLVDVRDALYTPDQEVHLRRSGAILETRV